MFVTTRWNYSRLLFILRVLNSWTRIDYIHTHVKVLRVNCDIHAVRTSTQANVGFSFPSISWFAVLLVRSHQHSISLLPNWCLASVCRYVSCSLFFHALLLSRSHTHSFSARSVPVSVCQQAAAAAAVKLTSVFKKFDCRTSQ